MNDILFDENMTFKEVVGCIEAKKTLIQGVLAFFSCFDIQEEIRFKIFLKKQVYSLKFEEWRKDKIIEYIYDDIEYEILKKLV